MNAPRTSASAAGPRRPASSLPPLEAAPAPLVNRTHRVVRERARTLQARRSLVRGLWLPLAVCSGLLLVVCTALWTVLSEYELAPTGLPDSSQQMFVLLLWCLPLSAALGGFLWFRRNGARTGGGGML